MNRREFLKLSLATGTASYLATTQFGMLSHAFAATQGPGLSDPAMQPMFSAVVPNALDPGFIYDLGKARNKSIKVGVGQTVQMTGLIGTNGVTPVPTTVWGYGDKGFYTWPGRTFQVNSNDKLEVKWENHLGGLPFPITGKDNTNVDGVNYGDYTGRSVVDTSLH